MNTNQQSFDEPSVRRFECDGSVVLAADVGVADDTSVDGLDDTMIPVTDEEQYERPLPLTTHGRLSTTASSLSNCQARTQ